MLDKEACSVGLFGTYTSIFSWSNILCPVLVALFLVNRDVCLRTLTTWFFVSPTAAGLHFMVDIVQSYCISHQIRINAAKSFLLSTSSFSPTVYVFGSCINIVNGVKCIGFHLCNYFRGLLSVSCLLAAIMGRFRRNYRNSQLPKLTFTFKIT